MTVSRDSFSSRASFNVEGRPFDIFSLERFEKKAGSLSHLPFSLKILLENLLRHEDDRFVKPEDIQTLAKSFKNRASDKEISFMPARVLMQDFTGVPAIVDLAAMRDAMAQLGGSPSRINPQVPVDLVVDHSVQVDRFGTLDAFSYNSKVEFERNKERYAFLKWGQKAFKNFRVVPPETGICHQVNLEFLAQCVMTHAEDGKTLAFPDSVVGTDSHTTMINGLGVLGWGVGGIEAEAAMLGQPLSMLIPDVVGFKLTGQLQEGATATDAVLTVTEILRKRGVVGKFVEFYGPGLSSLSLADRATIANMSPEYGATMGFFPIDQETLRYLTMTNRRPELVRLVEAYTKAQGLFRTDHTPDPVFSDTLWLDLATIEPSLAGPRRPQDRVALKNSKPAWEQVLPSFLKTSSPAAVGGGSMASPPAAGGNDVNKRVKVKSDDKTFEISHGSVVIAAITSCTNTSNPAVMLGAGLLAKKAVERGLQSRPWVKTSLAPGSKVVMDYLKSAGVLPYLEKLGFALVGYGCTTCIGNSGPLPPSIAQAVSENDLVVAAVLSGNRNFEGRINPHVQASYLASPLLVVAYALAGHMDTDLYKEPLGTDTKGRLVYLKDLWPTPKEIQSAMQSVQKTMFEKQYAHVSDGDDNWNSLSVAIGERFAWDAKSTYVKNPPYFKNLKLEVSTLQDIAQARVLAVLGDSITTDHISPAGSIKKDGPAGKYLINHGVQPQDFNSYGARRGNDEVMARGTFANIRLKNLLAPGTDGGVTLHLPDKKPMSIFEAAQLYMRENTPLIVLVGKEYGSGSSRDWAAKGPALLGVKAVIAESYERIHRSNLIGMGVLPLQFKSGENRQTLGLTGEEVYSIQGIAQGLKPKREITVKADGRTFTVVARIDTPEELEYYRHGGILPYVLRQLLKTK
jgi:aconitate hydratase